MAAAASAPHFLLCALLTLAVAHGATVPADTQALLQFKSELDSDGVRSPAPGGAWQCCNHAMLGMHAPVSQDADDFTITSICRELGKLLEAHFHVACMPHRLLCVRQ